MKILFYRYNSICEPDIIWAFNFLGIEYREVTIEMEEKEPDKQHVLRTVSGLLDSGEFHAVFSINYYPILSAICQIYKIRYISWTVDSPVMTLFSKTLSNEWNRTFVFDRADYDYFKKEGGDHIFHLPLAANIRRVEEHLSKMPSNPKFGGDIAFVGSLYTEKNPYERFTGKGTKLGGYLDGIMDAQSRIYGAFILPELLNNEVISEFKKSLPGYYTPPEDFYVDDAMTMSMLYLGSKIAVMERKRLLTMLGERFKVNLYTGSDSRGLPVKNCGRVKSLEEMPIVFRDAKINLNLTMKSIRTGVPQRVFDVLSCGGFLITNYQQEIAELFPSGLVMFSGDEDLMALADYYLGHENERKEIAMEGAAMIREHHSIEKRVARMLEMAFGA